MREARTATTALEYRNRALQYYTASFRLNKYFHWKYTHVGLNSNQNRLQIGL